MQSKLSVEKRLSIRADAARFGLRITGREREESLLLNPALKEKRMREWRLLLKEEHRQRYAQALGLDVKKAEIMDIIREMRRIISARNLVAKRSLYSSDYRLTVEEIGHEKSVLQLASELGIPLNTPYLEVLRIRDERYPAPPKQPPSPEIVALVETARNKYPPGTVVQRVSTVTDGAGVVRECVTLYNVGHIFEDSGSIELRQRGSLQSDAVSLDGFDVQYQIVTSAEAIRVYDQRRPQFDPRMFK